MAGVNRLPAYPQRLTTVRVNVLLVSVMLAASPSGAQGSPAAPQHPSSSENEKTVVTAPVSIARVRAALEKPPPILVPPTRKADFTVRIEKRLPLQDMFDTPPWATPAVGPAGGGGIDVVALLRAARRAYAEHAARLEVKRVIADYCAAQPDGGAKIQICSTAR